MASPLEEGTGRGIDFVRNIIEQFRQGLFQVLGVLAGFPFQARHAVRQV
jgi:hypothetical protein